MVSHNCPCSLLQTHKTIAQLTNDGVLASTNNMADFGFSVSRLVQSGAFQLHRTTMLTLYRHQILQQTLQLNSRARSSPLSGSTDQDREIWADWGRMTAQVSSTHSSRLLRLASLKKWLNFFVESSINNKASDSSAPAANYLVLRVMLSLSTEKHMGGLCLSCLKYPLAWIKF